MSFHTIDYLLFLPLAVAAFFATPHRARWIVLLIASIIFYASWRVEFIVLLLFSTVLDYTVARIMPRARGAMRHVLLAISMGGNLGLLLFFKFLPDNAQSWFDAAWQMDEGGTTPMLFLLPLGISFYTFQTLSYSIDVYRGKIEPELHLGKFATYVMFFPQLLAGPIERFGTLMPQLVKEQHFDLDRTAAGLGLFVVGLFKKVVLADGLAGVLGGSALESNLETGLSSALAALGTLYRYYCDLSGYADMAIGSALILGIRLSQNFNRPFAAKSALAFWQRWHISVSNWFRDYLYLPAMLKLPDFPAKRFLGIMATMLCVGLWHGANWNWLLVGALAGIAISASNAMRRLAIRSSYGAPAKRVLDGIDLVSVWLMMLPIGALLIGDNLQEAWAIFRRMGSAPADILSLDSTALPTVPAYLLIAIVALEIYQWFDSRQPVHHALVARGRLVSWSFYLALILIILTFGTYGNPDFLYFEF